MSLDSRMRVAEGDHRLELGRLIEEESQGKLIQCLDDGWVRLIDVMGNDAAVVQAARVSYGAGTKSHSDDRGLIRRLMRDRHTSPFEMVDLKFHIRAPMDTWRQWIRHRTASVNEYSTRYSLAIDSAQTTAPDRWRLQDKSNKQGSSGFLIVCPDDGDFAARADGQYGEALSEQERMLQALAGQVYKQRIAAGVAREQARKDLPLSTYTEAYWKIDLHNLFNFLRLRMDGHAQAEIREYANALGEFVRRQTPLCWEAFNDYQLRAVTVSGPEIVALNHMHLGFERACELAGLKGSEARDFAEKRTRLGFHQLSDAPTATSPPILACA